MFPASSKGGGTTAGSPDVCKTPAPPAPFAPIQYQHIATIRHCTKTKNKVNIINTDTIVEDSHTNSSKGDEAGTMKGMVQPSGSGKGEFLMGSMTVFAQGKGVVVVLTPMSANKKNLPAGAAQVAPSQTGVTAAK